MDYNQNEHSISNLITPFKKVNQKKNTLVKTKSSKNKESIETPQSNTLDNSSQRYSLSTLIHNVSNYKKEVGEELNIDVDSIKPKNLKNINKTTRSSFSSKVSYNIDNFQNSLKQAKRNKFTINLHKEINRPNISNLVNKIYSSENNIPDNYTTSTIIKDQPIDFYSLFPIEKLSRFETKFIILMTKIKSCKYMKEEYIKWIDDFQTSPFYEFSLNNRNIKSNDFISLLIKSSINLIILSIITGFWVENNNDTINNKEMLNKFSSELIINNHQLYLLLCLYIILEGKFMLWSQVNGRVVRLLEQIKIYLNNIMSEFNDKELVIKEIKNANSRVVRSIHKILNFENLFCPDISNYLRDINSIDILQLYELFNKLQNYDIYINNYNNTMNRTITNYYTLPFQFENNNNNIFQVKNNNDNNMQNSSKIYFKKFANHNNNKIRNKNRIINIIINNNNNDEINDINKINSVNNTEIFDESKYISVNLKKYGYGNNYNTTNISKHKDNVKNINQNSTQFNGVLTHMRNNDNLKNNYFNDKNNNTYKNKINSYRTIDSNNKYYQTSKNIFLSKFRLADKDESSPTPVNTDTNNNSNIINYEPVNPVFSRANIYENDNKNNSNNKSNNNVNKNSYVQEKLIKPACPYLNKDTGGKRFTLVLDLDETLVQFCIDSQKFNKEKKVILRPGLFEFLNKVYPLFELVVWTVATKEYADPIIDIIEEKKKYFSYRLYREYATDKKVCFVKDLTKLGRNLSKVIIIDDKAVSFSLQKENGILIKPFIGSSWELRYDVILYDLFKVLTKIILIKSTDVREGIQKYKYEIQQKISKINCKINFYDDNNENYLNSNETDKNGKEDPWNKKYQKIKVFRNKEDRLEKYNSARMKK